MTEWFKVVDCKSIGFCQHRFESCLLQGFWLLFGFIDKNVFLIPSFRSYRGIFGGGISNKVYSSRLSRRLAVYGYGTGVFRSLVRLGFCWNMLRQGQGIYRPVVACSLFRGWGLVTFWLFCCQLFWYGFMFWSLDVGLPLRFEACRPVLVVYTRRFVPVGAGRRPLYGVPVNGGYVDSNLVRASDLVPKVSGRVIVDSRHRSVIRCGVYANRFLLSGTSRRFYRSAQRVRRACSSAIRALWPMKNRLFWFRTHRLLSRFGGDRHIFCFRRRLRGLRRLLPGPVSRKYRFVRKFRALFTVRALHTNLFFTIRQGSTYFVASTGMFEDLKHGTKRKRTLLAGWFLADRLFERASPSLKEKTIFRVDLVGRTSGRRGIWFSWRTKPWRLYIIKSRTPIAYNGTRGCRRRRL